VIGEIARLLPADRELRFTTDPDRILELSGAHGTGSDRPSVRAARLGVHPELLNGGARLRRPASKKRNKSAPITKPRR
jgi:hypothetical protein